MEDIGSPFGGNWRHKCLPNLKPRISTAQERWLTRVSGDETTDFDVAANTDIPDNRFAQRIACVFNHRLFRHWPPYTLDWYPIASGAHLIDGSMAIGNIAAKGASRAANPFEPGTNVIRHIFKLPAIDCTSSS